jgi:hypothetical protein
MYSNSRRNPRRDRAPALHPPKFETRRTRTGDVSVGTGDTDGGGCRPARHGRVLANDQHALIIPLEERLEGNNFSLSSTFCQQLPF